MNKEKCEIEDIINTIKYNDIFEVHLNSDVLKFTESIVNVAFGILENRIYITFNDAYAINDDYDFLNDLTEENISKGINIICCDNNGDILAKIEFEKCSLKDITSIILDYNKKPAKQYIAIIEYSDMYMIKSYE